MQRFQTYRNRWVGALWQASGIPVVPTVGWSDRTPAFFFDGLPRRSPVSVGTIGLTDAEGEDLFRLGFAAMEDALEPSLVLVYGNLDFEARVPILRIPYQHWWHDWQTRQGTTWYDRHSTGDARVKRTSSSSAVR